MLFNKNYLLLLILISSTCCAQDKENADIRDVTKLTVINPGISYEKRIGKFQSLSAQAMMNMSMGFSYSSSLGFNSFFQLDPALALQYRYYYNFLRRDEKGKRTEMNSLNYVAVITKAVFSKDRISTEYYPEDDLRGIYSMGLAWGFQRNYHKRFSLDLSMGPGFFTTNVTTVDDLGQFSSKRIGEFTTVGQLTLGIWLNKRE